MSTTNPNNRCLSIVLQPVDQENVKLILGFLGEKKVISAIRFGLRVGAEDIQEQKEVKQLLRESRAEYITKHTAKE